MRRAVAGLVVLWLVGLVGAASAASPTWQGLYVGIHADHDLTAMKLSVPTYGSFDGLGMETVYGGALLGFNHRLSQRLVAGAEIDGAFGHGGSHLNIFDNGDYFNTWIKNDWTASAHARIGYLVSPDTLFYLSGGAVVAHASWGCDSNVYSCPASEGRSFYGWLFVGIGAETALGNDWRLRYEYQTRFLNTTNWDGVEVTPLSGMARIALIKDLGIHTGQPMAYGPFGTSPASWTGFYMGGVGGYTIGDTNVFGSDVDTGASFTGFSGRGFTGGIVTGLNYQVGQHVFGVEANFLWSNAQIRATADGYGSFNIAHDTYFSVRGRAGVIVNPSTMVYGLAGRLRVNASVNVWDEFGTLVETLPFDITGWEFGGGIETWLNKHWSVKAEYAYALFGETERNVGTDEIDEIGYRKHVGTATIGAVLHFGGPDR